MILRLFLTVAAIAVTSYAAQTALNQHIHHFEGLNYDRNELNERHQRAKRSTESRIASHRTVELKFSAHERDFHIRLKRDTEIFTRDFVIEGDGGHEKTADTSHIYRGYLQDYPSSLVHGSIIDGLFEGKVYIDGEEFYIEPASRYIEEPKDFHSVIYKGSDVTHPYLDEMRHTCGATEKTRKWMKEVQESAEPDDMEENSILGIQGHMEDDDKYSDPNSRWRRQANANQDNTCTLYIQADHLYTAAFRDDENAVIAQIASHVSAVNAIYNKADFQGRRGVGFQVQRTRLNYTNPDAQDSTNPFRFDNIGVEKFLELNSEQDHSKYCLAYIFTNRDFDDGVLGLAWVASPSGASGGICEDYIMYSSGSRKSLNTGIITIQNYGSKVPSKVSHITFAHELGHNFGSPHDYPLDCRPGDSTTPDAVNGNYIMYPRATSGDKANNNQFSLCSRGNMSLVLNAKADKCFVSSDMAFCGNGIVDEGEECDCGFADQCTDQCCEAETESGNPNACKRKAGKVCSPSEGPCCNDQCEFRLKAENHTCSVASDCAKASYCDAASQPGGEEAYCPPAQLEPNRTACNNNRQVCWSGECTGSICEAAGVMMEECFCQGDEADENEKCHLCCQEPGKPETCKSSSQIEALKQYYPEDADVITMQPGAPCDNFQGYCDVFDKCRLVDADGPLARLKNAIFNPEVYEDIADWVTKYWWAVVLMGVGLIILMGLFIKVCSVHTPSSNPKLPPARTLSRKRQPNRTRDMEMRHK
ncbi:disintegrin and metalloproteinase domain-containing protein 10-like [Ptychodera flava]|uniref:disintegrin and metalloproteinase domain-containing protein 10-like n=1 Tax=Ptychodera flava TaxID=63121 RepID=UPI003969D790